MINGLLLVLNQFCFNGGLLMINFKGPNFAVLQKRRNYAKYFINTNLKSKWKDHLGTKGNFS